MVSGDEVGRGMERDSSPNRSFKISHQKSGRSDLHFNNVNNVNFSIATVWRMVCQVWKQNGQLEAIEEFGFRNDSWTNQRMVKV